MDSQPKAALHARRSGGTLKCCWKETLMRATALTTGFVISLLSFSFVSGDCLLRRVATDGAWATFHCTEKWDDGTERAFYVTIKSVGTATVDDQPARWIELKIHDDDGKTKGKGTLFKFLVLEKHLKVDGDPLNNVLKVWRKRRDDIPAAINDLNFDLPRLDLFISQPIKNLKKTDQHRTVDWQGGQLTCDVLEGSRRFEHRIGNDETHYLLAVHENVPFGVAAATLSVACDDGVTGTVDFRITDFGTNATSDLPDLK
jgi:hypothetical protein